MNGIYLIIDTATPDLQVGFVYNCHNRIDKVSSAKGNIFELLPNLIKQLMSKISFEDLEGIIYCYGPGTTLGLRLCVTMINVWAKLCRKEFQLFRYSSLDMAANITNFDNSVTVCVNNGKYLTRTVNGEYIICDAIDEKSLFLQTKRLSKHCNNALVQYDISQYHGSIFDITNLITKPELFCVEEKNFTKWNGKRHC